MKIGTALIKLADTEISFNFREDSIGDKGVIHQIFQNQDYAIAHWAQGKKLIEYHLRHSQQRPSLIIDAGANIGASAVYFSLTYPNTVLFAIEPDKMNWHLLEINTAGLNVFNFNGAIADTDGELALIDPGKSDWGFVTTPLGSENAHNAKKVKSISPASILAHSATQNTTPPNIKN